jgi:two-component system, OmpR family, response regulator QseB
LRLLLVDDDAGIRELLRATFEAVDVELDEAENADAALDILLRNRPDAIVLDVSMPDVDGLEVCRRLRAAGDRTPVLMLTARDAVDDRVAGLDAGADDYLVKPFDLDELAARVRALQRRSVGRAEPLVEHGRLTLDPATHEVVLGGTPVALSPREFSLLHALLEHPGRPISRARLEEHLYGWGEQVESNAVEVHVHALRRKLGPEWIKTLRGVGYMVPKRP